MPWLQGHFSPHEVSKVSFRLFTYDLLAQDCGYYYKADNECSYVTAHLAKKMMFFSKDGKLIGQVGLTIIPAQSNVPCRKWIFLKGTRNVPEETVLFDETVRQALERLDQKRKAFYIVGLLTIVGLSERDLIITKPSSGNSIMESVEAEMRKAEQEVETALH